MARPGGAPRWPARTDPVGWSARCTRPARFAGVVRGTRPARSSGVARGWSSALLALLSGLVLVPMVAADVQVWSLTAIRTDDGDLVLAGGPGLTDDRAEDFALEPGATARWTTQPLPTSAVANGTWVLTLVDATHGGWSVAPQVRLGVSGNGNYRAIGPGSVDDADEGTPGIHVRRNGPTLVAQATVPLAAGSRLVLDLHNPGDTPAILDFTAGLQDAGRPSFLAFDARSPGAFAVPEASALGLAVVGASLFALVGLIASRRRPG